MDLFDIKIRRREHPEINLTPILDMLVSIIFFLLIFCVFSEYSQVSLPAIQEVSGNTSQEPLLAPKVLVRSAPSGQVKLDLIWAGEHPGYQTKTVAASEFNSAQAWTRILKSFTASFAQQYPKQKSIEVGLEGAFSYQHLVFVIDSLAEQFPDVALIDPKKVSKFGGPR